MDVVISIAHSEENKNAHFHDFYEYDESKFWSYRLHELLSMWKIKSKVISKTTLEEKVTIINSIKPKLALAIHFNAYEGDAKPKPSGCETLYYPGSTKGRVLATLVHKCYSPFIHFDRGVKEGWYYKGNGDRKVPLYFLRYTTMPAIIIEPEYIYNKISIIKYRDIVIPTIACGIKEYIVYHGD